MNDGLIMNMSQANIDTAISKANEETVETLEEAITCTNGKDDYCVGLRNGMRFAIYCITGIDTEFEQTHSEK
jgi:hypothetical protein